VSVCRQSAQVSRLRLAGKSVSASRPVPRTFRSRCVERLVSGLQRLLELCQMGWVVVSIESRQAFRAGSAGLSVAERRLALHTSQATCVVDSAFEYRQAAG
jgi:hypothetical protein